MYKTFQNSFVQFFNFVANEIMLYRHIIGISLLMVVVLLWVSSSVITQKIFVGLSFTAPFFLTYFNTALFTLYLLPPLIKILLSRIYTESISKPYQGIDENLVDQSSPVSSNGDNKLPWKRVLKHSLVFCPIWFSMNYFFNLSLAKTSVASNTIMSSTSSLFTLAFSACFLKSKITLYNGLGAVFA